MGCLGVFVVLGMVLVLSAAQRSFYAGLRAIGYPETEDNKIKQYSEDASLPIEARGDKDLVDRLNKLPVDKRPFWLLNSQAYDQLREHPQTYPLRQNGFLDNP